MIKKLTKKNKLSPWRLYKLDLIQESITCGYDPLSTRYIIHGTIVTFDLIDIINWILHKEYKTERAVD